MPSQTDYDAGVVGGGFFGCSLAVHLARDRRQRVALFEKEDDLLQRASFANQARVHNGYHYPRSLITAIRCRVNFPRFLADYGDCIAGDIETYYAVGRLFSSTTAAQYRRFCESIGAPIRPAPSRIRRLFNPDLVEDVFSVHELSFDAVRLKAHLRRRLLEHAVDVRVGCEVGRVGASGGGGLEISVSTPQGPVTVSAAALYNCAYSGINHVLAASGLPLIHLKHELTEMPIVEVPEEIHGKAFTMMCGPFFSLMPFPPRGLYTLSHVRYTPHAEIHDVSGTHWRDPRTLLRAANRRSHYPQMIRDAARYMPCLSDCKQVDSIWEVKTLLPRSEVDDSRPVLYREDCGIAGLSCVLGGKIDNVYDVLEVMTGAAAGAPGI